MRLMLYTDIPKGWRLSVSVAWILISCIAILFLYASTIALMQFDSRLTIDPSAQRFTDNTNPHLLHGLRSIRVTADENDFHELNLNGKKEVSIGQYSLLNREILLLEPLGLDVDTYWHELGHHIYYQLLTSEEIKAFDKIHNSSFATKTFPTKYASTDAKEDFADSFELWVFGMNDPIGRRLDPAREQMINSSIARITNCTLDRACAHPPLFAAS